MKRARRLSQKVLLDLLIGSGYKHVDEFMADVHSAIEEAKNLSDILRTVRGEEGPSPRLIQNQMWELTVDIMVGDYEHDETLYYFGKEEDAEKYLSSYLETIWGTAGETVYDNIDDCYYSKNKDRFATYGGVRLYDTVTAMTEKGTLAYEPVWRLK